MKRHYFVQQMNNNQQRMAPVGVCTISSAVSTEDASKGGGTANAGYDGTGDADQSPPDYGIVNIYQKSSGELNSFDGKGKSLYEGSHEKSESEQGANGADEDSDIITEYIGHYGLWQFYWTFLLCLFQIPTTFHIFCLVFQAANRDFWCARPAHLRSIPLELWRNLTQPDGGQCSLLNAPYQQLTALNFTDYFGSVNVSSLELVSCQGYEFDSRIFGQTVITEFGLVCDRAQMMSIVEMCFLAGAAMGAVGSGWISDQFGRRHTLMCFALIQAITDYPEITLATRNERTVGSFFTNTKDVIPPPMKTNVIYRVSCNSCDASYVGLTTNTLKKRLSNHQSDVNKMNRLLERNPESPTTSYEILHLKEKTALLQHCLEEEHRFAFNRTKILDQHRRSSALPVLEVCHIINTDHPVNKRSDVDCLSSQYAGLLHTLRNRRTELNNREGAQSNLLEEDQAPTNNAQILLPTCMQDFTAQKKTKRRLEK